MDNIYLLPFRHKHLESLKELHSLRDNTPNTPIDYADLPKIGYIAFLGKQPVAAGFLRRLEPNYAQLDTFLSNPLFGSQIRHLAIDMVASTLIQEAKDLELKGILVMTKDQGILSRAKDKGFHIIEQTLLGKTLQ